MKKGLISAVTTKANSGLDSFPEYDPDLGDCAEGIWEVIQETCNTYTDTVLEQNEDGEKEGEE